MKLIINSLYIEPGITFSISHKVINLLRDKLTKSIMTPYGLTDENPDTFLGLIISTNRETRDTLVKGPDHDKRNKVVNYGLWLPYRKIINSKDILDAYLTCLFNAIVILFKTFNVNEKDVRKIESEIKQEVLGNPNYKFKEQC